MSKHVSLEREIRALPGSFGMAVVESNSFVRHFADVIDWLEQQGSPTRIDWGVGRGTIRAIFKFDNQSDALLFKLRFG